MAVNKEFEKLYRENYKTVYFTALQLMGNDADAQDVTQDTFITAFVKFGDLKDKDSFSAWVKRIAINKCMDQLRKQKPIPTEDEELELVAEQEAEEDFLQEEYVLSEEKRKIVMNIMKSVLSKKQYETVILFYFDELSVEEIAKLLEVPEGTILSRLSVSRAKIKKGVLEYEKKNNDKLYCVIMLPFLTRLLQAEAEAITLPEFIPESVQNAMCPDNTITTGSVTKVAGKGLMMKKVIILLSAIAAAGVVIIGGVAIVAGIVFSVVASHNKTGTGVNTTQTEDTKEGSLFSTSNSNSDGDSKALKLGETDLTYMDYPNYNDDGEYIGNLRVYTNNTNQDIELELTYEGMAGDKPETLFVPAQGSNCRKFYSANKLGITDVEGYNIKAVAYEPFSGYIYDRAEDYDLYINETKTGLDIVCEYVGDSTQPFDVSGCYYAVFYDINNQVMSVEDGVSIDFRNAQKGDKNAGFVTFSKGLEEEYDHYEIFYHLGVKDNDYTDYEDVITIKEIATYKSSDIREETVFEVTNTSDVPKDGTFSVIGYDSEGNIAVTYPHVSTKVLEAGDTTYIDAVPYWWQGYESYAQIDHLEYYLEYVSNVDVESKTYRKDMTSYVQLGEYELKETYTGERIEIPYTNISEEEIDVYIYILFYDAEGNLVYGKKTRSNLDPGEDDDITINIESDIWGQVDHYDTLVRAMIAH